jgi:hypothetical protein
MLILAASDDWDLKTTGLGTILDDANTRLLSRLNALEQKFGLYLMSTIAYHRRSLKNNLCLHGGSKFEPKNSSRTTTS